MSAYSQMEEDDYYPKTLQEELNEILEAFYAAVPEEDIRQYQRYLESIQEQKIAQSALKQNDTAPDFELQDQDGCTVCLKELLQTGPVVLIFYRGKWCPHCNATLMRFQRCLEEITNKGATLVAISPMLPDGTHFLATKRQLQYAVLSDINNVVARQYKITFVIPPEVRPSMVSWGEDVPQFNGEITPWEIPLPATYVIDQQQRIVYSFLDNDPGRRAEPADVIAAIPKNHNSVQNKNGIIERRQDEKEEEMKLSHLFDRLNMKCTTCKQNRRQLRKEMEDDLDSSTSSLGHSSLGSSSLGSSSLGARTRKLNAALIKKSIKCVFGKKKQPPGEFLAQYQV